MTKVVILAGGLGTRLAEETEVKPKPMVMIGDRPILWHIMKIYAHHGLKEFFIALGYKGEVIKRYFLDYFALSGSMSINLANGEVQPYQQDCEDWVLHLMDTGLSTMTGGRVKRLEPWLRDATFMVTYGDGVSNVNIRALLEFHRSQGKIATLTAVRPPARFGGIIFDGDLVGQFTEKPQTGEGWINGGFLVLEPAIFQYLEGDEDGLEVSLLERLAQDGELAAYRHYDFWQCMDTLRDKITLENLWKSESPPWKVWH
ncbi:glucose-1-phosphate cytidylyltransferase [Gloeocapsa sp. PCC 73106]|uniref:glucose-1-phosphate cytidylyltransferase n=1 Tax=Gloeocapsa sp. PCC 73106 TaxID=102232 RepID=UPI0002AC8130|nr:glucose-1-phosphate cytidylyltransferase [Gloeocapsa sp. PCC 73106]ELR98324.1 glucose-1-phosphate cytidylyltransferase [Gloeocapsa sp. PCC 73106]